MGLNVGLPALSKAIGKSLGGKEGEMVGEMVGKVANDLIKKQTGYGRKQQMDGGISLSKLKKKTKPYVSAGLDAVVPGVGGLVGTVVGTLAGQLGREGIGRVSLILNPSSRSGLEFGVSELGLYFQIEKKSFTKI